MIDGKRVAVWTPYGRESTVSILKQYIFRELHRGIVDEWWLCLNTDPAQISDLRYAYELAASAPGWVKTVHRPAGFPRLSPKQRNTGYFYRYMTDPDTVYIRLDDDIVYVEPDAIERLARHRLQTSEGVASFALIWNNAICSWFLQRSGVIPEEGTHTSGDAHESTNTSCPAYTWPRVGGPYCMDPVGWADGRFAVEMHRLLIDHIENNSVGELFLYQDFPLRVGEQFSVSAFASLGSMYSALPQPGVLEPSEEESWHTVHQPRKIGQPNMIVGNALVSHYTFFPQRAIVEPTDILQRYRELARYV